jgi:hypothetical protein
VDLGGTVGKIPPIGWALAIGGGLFIAFYLRGNSSSGTPVDITGGVGTGAGTSTFIPAAPPTPSTDTPIDIETWGVKALAFLIGAGYPPLEASQAIRKFIDGQQISSKEKAMIDAALKGVPGLSGIPVGGGVTPTPTPVDTSKPVFGPQGDFWQNGQHYSAGKWHTVMPGETWESVAAFYGRTSEQLRQANKDRVPLGQPLRPWNVIWIVEVPI